MSQRFTITVNGKSHTINADPDMPLLYALRDELGLNNPHPTRYSTPPAFEFAVCRFLLSG
jgi:aerobic-type carbon monoxide dehydrogenase small subunit (CoxS/CutS family)